MCPSRSAKSSCHPHQCPSGPLGRPSHATPPPTAQLRPPRKEGGSRTKKGARRPASACRRCSGTLGTRLACCGTGGPWVRRGGTQPGSMLLCATSRASKTGPPDRSCTDTTVPASSWTRRGARRPSSQPSSCGSGSHSCASLCGTTITTSSLGRSARPRGASPTASSRFGGLGRSSGRLPSSSSQLWGVAARATWGSAFGMRSLTSSPATGAKAA
mmetsp:Transcript_36356/g.102440  ORF Transcript_36356/g.102440 Transcript_36356/m.102440 type:complete len:215 (-) Transcript_36356:2498-3142(-)